MVEKGDHDEFCLASAGVAFACTKHNPEACCSTADQCSSYGLSGITACEGTQVCNSTGACVAPQCTTNADCTDSTMPLCVNQICVAPQCTTNADCTDQTMPFCENDVCVAACGSDGDCTSMAGAPYCATSGACVGCIDDTQCTAQAPVCDSTSNACRGCQKDSECTGGVCVEATGTCTADANVIYVASFGMDTGTCTAEAPCASLAFALPLVTATRNVIHINTSDFDLGTAPVAIGESVIIDGIGTTVRVDGSAAPYWFSMTTPTTNITLENSTINGGSAVNVGAGVALTLFSRHALRVGADYKRCGLRELGDLHEHGVWHPGHLVLGRNPHNRQEHIHQLLLGLDQLHADGSAHKVR